MPEPGDVVVATNRESLPFTIKWNKREYKLTPNQPVFLPFEAACNWFGDPRSLTDMKSYTGIDGLTAFVPDRATEVRRLRRKYGAVYGDEMSFENAAMDNGHNQPGDPCYIPQIEVTSPDGEKLWMVVEDPFGEHAETATQTVSGQTEMLQQLRRQQAQIDLLMSQLNGEQPDMKLGEVDDDGNIQPPTDDSDVGSAIKAIS